MSRHIALLFPFFLFLSLFSLSQSPVVTHGNLSVSGNQILNSNGDTVSFAGSSLFWSNNFWGGEKYYNSPTVDWLSQDWGISIIRASMGVEDSGGYISDTSNAQKVRTVVDAAIANDIYVIIDWHSHHAENYQTEAIAFFQDMATRYGSYPNVIYEIYNEPLAVSWSGVIKPYAQSVISAIRAIDSDNLIVVGSSTWSQDVDVASLDPITGYSNIAYSLHFYAGTHGLSLRNKAQTAIDNGIALFVTEWGSVDASGNGAIDYASTDDWMDFLCTNKISHCNWAVNDKNETASALIPGTGVSGGWSASDLTASGTLVKGIILGWDSTCNPQINPNTCPPPIPVVTGDFSPCNASGIHTYSLTAEPNLEYNWTFQTTGGGTITPGSATGSSVDVDWGTNTPGSFGHIGLTIEDTIQSCQITTWLDTIWFHTSPTCNPPSCPTPSISGTYVSGLYLPCGQTTYTYCTPLVAGNTYNWTLENSLGDDHSSWIISGQGTNCITVYYLDGTGIATSPQGPGLWLAVTEAEPIGGCDSTAILTIDYGYGDPFIHYTGSVTGPDSVCVGDTAYFCASYSNYSFGYPIWSSITSSNQFNDPNCAPGGPATWGVGFVWSSPGTMDINKEDYPSQFDPCSDIMIEYKQVVVYDCSQPVCPPPIPTVTGDFLICSQSGTYTYNLTTEPNLQYSWIFQTTGGGTITPTSAIGSSVNVDWGSNTPGSFGHIGLTIEDTIQGCQVTTWLDTVWFGYSPHIIHDVVACDSFSWINGITYYSSVTNEQFLDTTLLGCDSLVELNLSLGYSTHITQTEQSCGPFLWDANGFEYQQSGTYTELLEDMVGCDSLITLNLNILIPNNWIDVQDSQLVATQDSALYQWLDCGNSYAPIAGETQQEFVPTISGSYAVLVTKDGCSDTSDCVMMNVVGQELSLKEENIMIFPNPGKKLTILLPSTGKISVSIYSTEGKLVSGTAFMQNVNHLSPDVSKLSEGLYHIEIQYQSGERMYGKWIKKNP